ncbi:hypothetical protein GCM10025771_20580 [Niveibacterium umoris]|uniref:General secretion pathway protein D n=1 Tax=Niveibacterium umoris TaxID=1193620 RepID=A0A840BM77_9RHOO|nr:pilus (MSHA type) biogenesis protein MshL [Niveibacterium umoris]MBB4012752.1 general secretion pathway protein D [Niveibacterium umoris]
MMRRAVSALSALAFLVSAGCAQNPVKPDTGKHIAPEAAASAPVNGPAPIPDPVQQSFALPRPKSAARTETHSVVVHNVKAQDLLFALARDARINVDVHPGVEGTVTLNALDQTLPQLLDRIAQQVDMRWEMRGETLVVKPDSPFLRLYKIDYLNMGRDSNAVVSVSSELGNAGVNGITSAATQSLNGGSNSSTHIENTSRNRFWETLIRNLQEILRETDKLVAADASATRSTAAAPASATPTAPAIALDKYLIERCRKLNPKDVDAMQSCYAQTSQEMLAAERVGRGAPEEVTSATTSGPTYREAASVIASPETGVVSVRATARQHEKVQEFLDRVIDSARRQVLIEATIAEVDLSQNYQQGVDWSKIDLSGTGFRISQGALGNIAAPASSLIEIGFTSKGGSFAGSVKLLESFGDVKVLSSPKVSVLNNQTAVLKVVDNSVYFTIQTNVQRGNGTSQGDLTTYNTTVHTVPIGLILNVTPQIGDNGTVILNVRPSLSRIVGKAVDPNPQLKLLNITNEIPVVRAREIESVIRVENGNIAVMGGLMEDAIEFNKDTVPGAAGLPLIGGLFQNRNDTRRKSELVILLRPTIVRQSSLEGDYREQRGSLPGNEFFKSESGPSLLNLDRIPTATGTK